MPVLCARLSVPWVTTQRRNLLFTQIAASFALLAVFGCSEPAPDWLDCRQAQAACPQGYQCTNLASEGGVGSWVCLAEGEGDLGEHDGSVEPDVGEPDAGEPETRVEDTGSTDTLFDVEEIAEPDEDIEEIEQDSSEFAEDTEGDSFIEKDTEDQRDEDVHVDSEEGGVEPDTGPIVAPLDVILGVPSDVLSGGMVITALPIGGAPLLGAEFLLNGFSIHTDIIPPYTAWLDTTKFPDGPHVLTVQVADVAGQTAESVRNVIFDNSPPKFDLVAPADGATVFFEDGPIPLVVQVSDASGIANVEMRAQGLLIASLSSPPFVASVPYDAIFLGQDQLPKSVFLQFSTTDGLGQETKISRTVHVHRRHRWSFDTVGEIWGSAAVLPNGNIVFGNQNAKVFAVNQAGAKVWEANTEGAVIVAPAVDSSNGQSFWGTTEGRVHAYNATGGSLWVKNPANSPISGAPARHGSWVVAATFAGGVYALNASNGNTAWSVNLPGQITASPTVGPDGTVYIGCKNSQLYAVQNGSILWSAFTGGEVWAQPVVGPEGRVYFGSNDGWFYAVNAGGVSLWERELKGEMWGTPLLTPDGFLYVGTTFKRIFKLNTNLGGLIVWETDVGGGITYSSPVLAADGTLYVGTTKGGAAQALLVGLSAEQGQIRFTFPVADTIHGTPLVIGEAVYVGHTARSLQSIWRYGADLGPPP